MVESAEMVEKGKLWRGTDGVRGTGTGTGTGTGVDYVEEGKSYYMGDGKGRKEGRDVLCCGALG